MKNYALALVLSLLVMLLMLTVGAHAANISFSTFVTGSSIAAQEGDNSSTTAFNYAGTKFGMMAVPRQRKY
jgi:hypothetical protein